jgi:hypothetical protein
VRSLQINLFFAPRKSGVNCGLFRYVWYRGLERNGHRIRARRGHPAAGNETSIFAAGCKLNQAAFVSFLRVKE